MGQGEFFVLFCFCFYDKIKSNLQRNSIVGIKICFVNVIQTI